MKARRLYYYYPLFYSVNIGIVSTSCHLYTLYQVNDLRQATFTGCYLYQALLISATLELMV